MDKEISKCVKLEDKVLKVLFGGYYKREDALRQQWESTMKDHSKLSIESELFKTLESQESQSLRARLIEAKQAVAYQEGKENELQMRYANLKTEKERLEKTLAYLKQAQHD